MEEKSSSARSCIRCKREFMVSYQFCSHCGYGVKGQDPLALATPVASKLIRPVSSSSAIKLAPLQRKSLVYKAIVPAKASSRVERKMQTQKTKFSKSAVSLPYDEKIENLRAKYKQQSKSLLEQAYTRFYRSMELEQVNSLSFEELENPPPIIRASVSAPSFDPLRPFTPSHHLNQLPSIDRLYRELHGDEVVYLSYTDQPDRLLQQPVKVIPTALATNRAGHDHMPSAYEDNSNDNGDGGVDDRARFNRARATIPVAASTSAKTERGEDDTHILEEIAQKGGGLWTNVSDSQYSSGSDSSDREDTAAADDAYLQRPLVDVAQPQEDDDDDTDARKNKPNEVEVEAEAEAESAGDPPITLPVQRMAATLQTQTQVLQDMLGEVRKMRGHYLQPPAGLLSAMLSPDSPASSINDSSVFSSSASVVLPGNEKHGDAKDREAPASPRSTSTHYYSYFSYYFPPWDSPLTSPREKEKDSSTPYLRDKDFLKSMTEWWDYVEKVKGDVGRGRQKVLEEVEAMFTPRSEGEGDDEVENGGVENHLLGDQTSALDDGLNSANDGTNRRNSADFTIASNDPSSKSYIPPDSLPLTPPLTPQPPLSDSSLVQDTVYERYLAQIFSRQLQAREIRSDSVKKQAASWEVHNPFLLMPTWEDHAEDGTGNNRSEPDQVVSRVTEAEDRKSEGIGIPASSPLPASSLADTDEAKEDEAESIDGTSQQQAEEEGLHTLSRIMKGVDDRDTRARGRHKIAQSIGQAGKGVDNDESLAHASIGQSGRGMDSTAITVNAGKGGGMFGVVWEDEEGEEMDWLFAMAEKDERHQRGASRGWGKGGNLSQEYQEVSDIVKRTAAHNLSSTSVKGRKSQNSPSFQGLITNPTSPSSSLHGNSNLHISSSDSPAHIQLSSLFMRTNAQLKKYLQVLEDLDALRAVPPSKRVEKGRQKEGVKLEVLDSTCQEAESFLNRLQGEEGGLRVEEGGIGVGGLEPTIKHIINGFFEKARQSRTSIVGEISSQYNKTAELERYFKEQVEVEGRKSTGDGSRSGSGSALVLHTKKKQAYSDEQLTIIHHAQQALQQCENNLNKLLRFESNLLKTLKEEEEMLLRSMSHWREKFVKERSKLKIAIQRVKVFLGS